MEFKAYAVRKTGTDAACESRECLHSMPSSEEEKPHLWVNLLSVNEHFEGKRNNKRAFLVIFFYLSYNSINSKLLPTTSR